MKLCKACGKEKPLDEFGKYSRSKDGRHYRCIECNRAVCRESYQRHKKKRVSEVKQYYRKNRERRLQKQKEWQEKNKGRVRDAQLKRKFGISAEEYDAMLEKQGGGCAICGRTEELRRYKNLAVDHCHETGAVRGILCQYCNRGLGFLGDNIESLQKAIDYLKKG